MASSADSPGRGRRAGLIALLTAWIVVLAAVAGFGGWLLFRFQESGVETTPIAVDIPAADQSASQRSSDPQPSQPVNTRPDKAVTPAPDPSDTQPPWQRYSFASRPAPIGPSIAVVLTGLGLDRAVTEAAIDRLPAGISLSFSPYAPKLQDWLTRARARRHEVLLDLPMEPENFPAEDPGPQALLTALSTKQNLVRLDWILERAEGYVGLAAALGSRFAAEAEQLRPILLAFQQQGLLFVDNRSSPESQAEALAAELELVHVGNDRFLDRPVTDRSGIDARLIQVERKALTEGRALAMAGPYPATIERLELWAASLKKNGFSLVPVTGLAQSGGGS